MKFARLATLLAAVLFAAVVNAQNPKDSKDKKLPEANKKVVEFVLKSLGEKVGDGECAALASAALKHAEAKSSREFKPEPPLKEDDYVWGKLLGSKEPPLPGDIIQFRDAKFEHATPNSKTWQSMPHHTAVVVSVGQRGLIEIVHQNVNGKRVAIKQQLNLNELKEGKLWFYRPEPQSP